MEWKEERDKWNIDRQIRYETNNDDDVVAVDVDNEDGQRQCWRQQFSTMNEFLAVLLCAIQSSCRINISMDFPCIRIRYTSTYLIQFIVADVRRCCWLFSFDRTIYSHMFYLGWVIHGNKANRIITRRICMNGRCITISMQMTVNEFFNYYSA